MSTLPFNSLLRLITAALIVPMFRLMMAIDDGGSSFGRGDGDGLISELISENYSVLKLSLELGL